MNKFIYRLTWFIIPIVMYFVLGLFLPTTPRASKSLLIANKQKDTMLRQAESPRMVFVGGSNLSFGLNSKMIKDELNINPINTGVHAGVGLRYMLKNTIQYVREGDIVILVPEYQHFYRDYNFANEILLRTIFDVDLSKIKLLNLQQAFNLISYIPKYSLSKIEPREYLNITEDDVYTVNAFNEYGDANIHWGMDQQEFQPMSINGEYNQSILLRILEFQAEVIRRKAILFVTYPGIQNMSYSNSIEQIERVAIEYGKYNLVTLGDPERYKIPNHMMFNTPYHLKKEGVDHRTRLFIADYRIINRNQPRAVFNFQDG